MRVAASIGPRRNQFASGDVDFVSTELAEMARAFNAKGRMSQGMVDALALDIAKALRAAIAAEADTAEVDFWETPFEIGISAGKSPRHKLVITLHDYDF